MSTSKHRNQPEPNHTKLYSVIGIIVCIAIAAILIWNSGALRSNADAVTIGDETFSVADVDFYYYTLRNNEANTAAMYAQYGIPYNFDYNIADELQMYDEERTYAEYFMDETLAQMQTIKVLCDEAEAAGFELSEEVEASYAGSLSSLEAQITYASLMRGSSERSYIQALYGPHANMAMLKDKLREQTIAGEYAIYISDGFTYEDADLEAYYEENTLDLDTFAYRSILVPAAAPVPEIDDITGMEIPVTEEQAAAAMEEAKVNAEELAERVRSGEDFNTAAMDYVGETEQASLADPEFAYTGNQLGTGLAPLFKTWIADEDATVGDIGVLEDSSANGYYVVSLLSRERDDSAREKASVYSAIFIAETLVNADNLLPLPTEEELAAAYAKAEAFEAEWEQTADRTEEVFQTLISAALAEATPATEEETPSDQPVSPISQVLFDVTPAGYGAAFDAFVFGANRAVGDSAIVDMEESDGSVSGARYIYISDLGPIRWMGAAETALRTADYDAFLEALKELAPIERLAGLAEVRVI